MTIQIDSREHAKAITKIIAEFDKQGIQYISSKLYVGDYQSFDNPRLIVDRKQNLTELYGNVIQDHARFTRELIKARDAGIKLIILIEHSPFIKSLEDVPKWDNPRMKAYKFQLKKQLHLFGEFSEWYLYKTAKTKGMKPNRPPVNSQKLYNMLCTMQENYDTQFLFCSKAETGKKIIELLGGNTDD